MTWNRLSLWTVCSCAPYRFPTHEVEFSSLPYQPCMCLSFIWYLLVWISDPKRPRCHQSVALLGDHGAFSMWSLQKLGHWRHHVLKGDIGPLLSPDSHKRAASATCSQHDVLPHHKCKGNRASGCGLKFWNHKPKYPSLFTTWLGQVLSHNNRMVANYNILVFQARNT